MIGGSRVNRRLRDSNPGFIWPSVYPVRLTVSEEESKLATQALQNGLLLGSLNAVQPTRERQEPTGPVRQLAPVCCNLDPQLSGSHQRPLALHFQQPRLQWQANAPAKAVQLAVRADHAVTRHQ